MSEATGEKSFEPTPSRLAKAKRDGNVARSAEFSSNVAFAASLGGLCAVAPPIGALARTALIRSAGGTTAFWGELVELLALAIVPLCCGAVGGVIAGIAQTGGIAVASLEIKLERLNPAEGIKRMLSRETALQLVRGSCAFALVALAVAFPLWPAAGSAVRATSPAAAAAVAWTTALRAMFATAAIGLAFSGLEYLAARNAWLRKLRMTFDEVKRDAKEQHGDPHVKGRRKSLHRDLMRGSMATVKDASFVVVNPTHVSIALEYRPPLVPVPVVLVAAADESALKVRELARQHRIPVIENVPLARALFRDAKPGQPISHDHYVAVAEIVAALVRSGALE